MIKDGLGWDGISLPDQKQDLEGRSWGLMDGVGVEEEGKVWVEQRRLGEVGVHRSIRCSDLCPSLTLSRVCTWHAVLSIALPVVPTDLTRKLIREHVLALPNTAAER